MSLIATAWTTGAARVRQTGPVPSDDGADGDRLLGGWVRHLRRLAPGVPRERLEAVGLDLLTRYGEPHRAYHDASHLSEVLAAVALLAEHADDLPVVVAAAWWHDAVYDVRAEAGCNEADSAELADGVLLGWAVEAGRAARVGALVRMTATHDPAAGDRDGEVLSDADLAVLAAGPARYGRYVADVRREYAHVPDAEFAAGRAAVLRQLLAHDRLYRTPDAALRWEQPARANLARELAALE
jgi:predicted metal-dependent HD superfamily phosphohydrolase